MVTVTDTAGFSACLCAPGDATLGVPALCCGDGSACPPGSTCAPVLGGEGLCLRPEMQCLEGTATAGISLEAATACFTPPGASMPGSYWQLGDCDGDGTPNGVEVRAMTDPCCNEVLDPSGCCLVATGDVGTCCGLASDPVSCCVAADRSTIECCSLSADPFGCCFAAGGAPMECCAGHDAVACCSAEPDPVACCRAAGGSEEACCAVAEDALACCLATASGAARCCGLYGRDDARCATVDAARPDAGPPPADTGSSGFDAGASGEDGGSLTFGGGGGCHCAAGRASPPSSLALLALALIAIPAVRRRR
jgi:hypothetical protein